MNKPVLTQQEDKNPDVSAFVGRHPIFDPNQQVVGYELLFRADTTNANSMGQGDEVSSILMNNSLNVLGLNTLTGGKTAFVNITRQLLLNGDYAVLPKERVVIELLENVTPDADVVRACKVLKDEGYILALDDFVSVQGYEGVLDLADIVKIDFLGTTADQRRSLLKQLEGYKCQVLAEKVETKDEFAEALGLGCTMVQGYYFCRPEIIEGKKMSGIHQNYLRLLAEVNRPNVDLDKLEEIIKSDVSLASKLLLYLNSASIGVRHKITSIKQAMVMLGAKPLAQWVSLVAITHIGSGKPDEVMVTSLKRARFCETIADHVDLNHRRFDLFMLGMLSMLDVLLNRPIEELLAPMPLSLDVKETLSGGTTALGKVLDLTIGCERNDCSLVIDLSSQLGLSGEHTEQIYRDAIFWADATSKNIAA